MGLKPKEDENVALNQSDINDIYNSGVPNLLHWYNMSE